MIDYLIEAAEPQAHRYRVTLNVPRPTAQQRLSLPVWIPGSYMVREFAATVAAAGPAGHARMPRRADRQVQLAGASARARQTLVLSYEVYAFDTSVRTAFLDDRRGFFNGTSLCLRVRGPRGRAAPAAHRPRCRAAGRWPPPCRPRRARPRVPVRRLRRTGRPPGRTGPLLARRVSRARRAARVRGRRRLARLRRRAAAGRRPAHLRGADRASGTAAASRRCRATCSC